MSNVTLVIHLILALILIGIVLIQRSEGGGLGIGGSGNLMTGRQAATALGKLTWLFAVAFLVTSLTLTILSARKLSTDSVVERLGDVLTSEGPTDALGLGSDLLLPEGTDEPALPPKAE